MWKCCVKRLKLRKGDGMAKMDFRMPEEFLLKLSKLNDRFDEIAPKVLDAGAQAVLEKEKANLEMELDRVNTFFPKGQ